MEMEDAQKPISLTLIFIWVFRTDSGGAEEEMDGWNFFSLLYFLYSGYCWISKSTLFIAFLVQTSYKTLI